MIIKSYIFIEVRWALYLYRFYFHNSTTVNIEAVLVNRNPQQYKETNIKEDKIRRVYQRIVSSLWNKT